MDYRRVGRAAVEALTALAALVVLYYAIRTGEFPFIAGVVLLVAFGIVFYFLTKPSEVAHPSEPPSSSASEPHLLGAPSVKGLKFPRSPPRTSGRVTKITFIKVAPLNRDYVDLDVRVGERIVGKIEEKEGHDFSWGLAGLLSHGSFMMGESGTTFVGGEGRTRYEVDYIVTETPLYLEFWVDKRDVPRNIWIDLLRA